MGPAHEDARLEMQKMAVNQRLAGQSTTAAPRSKMRLPTKLNQTNMARDDGGGIDGGGSGSSGRRFRLSYRR